MRMSSLVLLALLGGCGGSSSAADDASALPFDPLALAGEVSQTELEKTIAELGQMPTRYTLTQGDEQARDYLVARARALGLEPELDPFQVAGQTANNVIIRHPGTVTPDVIYIFSAHYDSTSSTPMTLAPGADDNATGVASVLEAARVLTKRSFRASVWFVFTAAEEQGSLGSKHMAQWLVTQGKDVRGVIAPDMIGYWPLGAQDKFDILGDPASKFLVDQMSDVATRLGVEHKTWINHGYCYGDDHTSFQEAGIPAITPMDCVEAHNLSVGEDTPNYHQTTDTASTLYMPFTTKVAGVIVATLAELGVPAP
jgi:bacterial leucyl aminopeptidase